MTQAYVLMTALPPTHGHLDLVKFAGHLDVSEVVLFLNTQPSEPMVLERAQALNQALSKLNRGERVTKYRLEWQNEETPQDPTEDPEAFWANWIGNLHRYGFKDGDYIVASEAYGVELAKRANGVFMPFDPDRWSRYTKGTSARNAPFTKGGWDQILPEFRQYLQKKVTIFGAESTGKALALDTPLPTPTGWTTMGAVQVGDYLLGEDGKPTKVSFATEVQTDRECYSVQFSDGSSIVADAEHLWLTDDYYSRESFGRKSRRIYSNRGVNRQEHKRVLPRVRSTVEIRETLRARGGRYLNHTIDAASPLRLPEKTFTVPPYVLGAWLGDGHTADGKMTIGGLDAAEMVTHFNNDGIPLHKTSAKYGYGAYGLKVKLRSAGVLGDKHIPLAYLRGSFDQRLALLQGLMDTDGTIDANQGRCEIGLSNERLAMDVYDLVISLGIVPRIRTRVPKFNGKAGKLSYRIGFTTDLPVFRLSRKLTRMQSVSKNATSRRRGIISVTPVESVPVRCVQVDNESHLYLAGRTMIPTHNTTLTKALSDAYWDIGIPTTKLFEWARPYLEMTGPEVTYEKMLSIWEGQQALQETAYENVLAPLVLQDTDLFTTLGFWEDWDPQTAPGGLGADAQGTVSDLYIILRSNIPFEHDILRYGGDERQTSDQYWIDFCEKYELPYVVLDENSLADRIGEAMDHISPLLENPIKYKRIGAEYETQES